MTVEIDSSDERDEDEYWWDFICACKDNDVQAVKAYIDQGYLKKENMVYDPFRSAFNLEAFDVCDLLLASGVNVSDYPFILHSYIIRPVATGLMV